MVIQNMELLPIQLWHGWCCPKGHFAWWDGIVQGVLGSLEGGVGGAGETKHCWGDHRRHLEGSTSHCYISLLSDNIVRQLTTWKVTYIATNGKALFQVLVTERIPQWWEMVHQSPTLNGIRHLRKNAAWESWTPGEKLTLMDFRCWSFTHRGLVAVLRGNKTFQEWSERYNLIQFRFMDSVCSKNRFVKRSQLKMVRKNVEKGKLGSAIVGLENKRWHGLTALVNKKLDIRKNIQAIQTRREYIWLVEKEWPDSVERERMANYRTPSQVVVVVIFVVVVSCGCFVL